MSNHSYKSYKKIIIQFILLILINFALSQNTENNSEKSPILYPSVLSLQNQGFVVVQTDGIHFYDSNKEEEESKNIKFDIPIKSEKENDKISIVQFPEKEGGYILILVGEKIYIIQKNGNLLKEVKLEELNLVENIKLVPYKEEGNYLLYIITFKNSEKLLCFNYYKYDLIKKENTLINKKVLKPLKNSANLIITKNEILGEKCLFMKNTDENKDVFTCFVGLGFPVEIQARIFSERNDNFEEINNFRYLIGQYEIENFKLITVIPNEEKNSSIIYYSKNNILSKIEFNFRKKFYASSIVKPYINFTDDSWEYEAKKVDETKETIFSSRLYWAYCKSYLLFFNSKFALTNKGFISYDNKCANLLPYFNFFEENKYGVVVENINNNILIQKKRKLQTTGTTVPEKCLQGDGGYNAESLIYNLCLKCNTAQDYYEVYDPDKSIYGHGQNFVQCFNNDTKKNFYLNESISQYQPCYETCNTCFGKGDAYNHNCATCALRYKYFEEKKLCEAECSYAYYYTIPLGYYECTETNSCPEGSSYLIPEKRKCVPQCLGSGYPYTYAGKCYKNCTAANAVEDVDNADKKTCKDKSGENAPRCAVSYESFDSDKFINAEGIKAKAETYAKDFANSLTHINYYNNDNAILVIYKDQTCIKELGLTVPEIDLDDACEEKIYSDLRSKHDEFDKTSDLIIALVGGATTSSGIKSSYSYFYKDGTYVNISEICQGAKVEVKNQIDLEEVDDEAEKIASQGINIFDLDSPFYNDVCFMYDSPNGRDATPNDRLNAYYPNISVCEAGCTPSKVDLDTFEAVCSCEINDIMSSSGGVGEKILEDSFGEVFEMIEASNVVIFKCIGDVFVAKHFFVNPGSYIVLGIMAADIACVLVYYLVSYNPMLRYLYYLSEYQCSVIDMKNNKKGDKETKTKDNILSTKLNKAKEPPKKDDKAGLKTPAIDKLIDEDEKQPQKLDINNNDQNVINSNNKLIKKKEEKNEKDILKKGNKNEKKPMYADKLKEEYDIEMDEYLKTDVEDMEFEDALKFDTRSFWEYFYDRFKEQQIIMDTFFNGESLKPMTIKIIILLLNIILYFVINGLFYSEDYVSDLFNSDVKKEDEGFFDFFPRSLSRFLYTTMVGVVIGIIVDFVAFDEKKVKRLFLREKKNTLQIRYEVSVMTKDIKRNYLILIIICFVIDLISLYYVNCFNNVYPNLCGEWIKSSIFIIILFQLLTVLLALLEALIRLIAFKLKSERIYKIKDLLG